MSTDYRKKSTRKIIRFNNDLLNEIQAVCGDNFSAWVKEACSEKLRKRKGLSARSK